MNKMIMNRLTMLAVTLMASMACFAQGKLATSIPGGLGKDAEFDYMELKYKIIDAESSYEVKVIGFADAFKADPSKFDTAEEGVEIHHHNEVFIPHYIGQDDKVAVNVYVSSVADGALNTTDSELANKVTALEIDYQDNIKTQGIPMTIGENAFAGLTSVATVKSLSPTPPTCPAGAFASSVKTLIVPEGSKVMGLYAKPNSGAWRKISTIKNTAGLQFGDVDQNKRLTGQDVSKLNQVLAKTATQNDACDTDGNGRLTGQDVSVLNQEIAKQYRK